MEHPRHIVVVGALVRNSEERLLLIRHHRRGWEIPQGRVEEGEGLLDALSREVREETGVEIEPGPLAAIHSKLTPPSALILTFLATATGGEPTPSEESPEVSWVEEAEAMSLVPHPVNRQRLETLLIYQGRPFFVSYATNPFRVVLQQAEQSCFGSG
jgi:8-oxo-dGTP diphosphatase